MEKITINSLFVLLLLFSSVLSMDAKEIPGEIHFKESGVKKVLLSVPTWALGTEPNYLKIQEGIKYRFSKDEKKRELRTYEAKEFRFKFNGDSIRMVSVSGQAFPEETGRLYGDVFLPIVVDGFCQLFKYYSSTGETSGQTAYLTFLLQKPKETLYPVAGSFKKRVSKYFKDCPKLEKRILDKTFRSRDLEKVVNFYNKECK